MEDRGLPQDSASSYQAAQENSAKKPGASQHDANGHRSPKTDALPKKSKSVYDNFMKTILEYNKKNNTPITEQPQIGGKTVNLYILYGYVLKVCLSAIQIL